MSDTQISEKTTGIGMLAARWFAKSSLAPFVACAAILLVASLWQLRWGTVPDVSWIITMCERLLDGDRLYVDIIETNPPFTVWLYMPAVALARFLATTPEPVVHLYVYAVTLAGFLSAIYIARAAAFPENRILFTWLPAFFTVLVILPGNTFGEREHFGTALLLPLIVLTAWRADPRSPTKPRFGSILIAGACASVIMLVKPYYAPVLIFPALFAAWRSRRFSTFVAPEYWLVLTICVAYLLAVLRVYPEYLDTVYPVLKVTYMRIWSMFPMIDYYLVPWSLLLFLAWWLSPPRLSPLPAVALIASAGAILPLIYQGKGWPYHAYPAVTLATFGVFHILILRRNGAAAVKERRYRPSPLLVAATLVAAWAPFFSTQKPDPVIVATIRAATDRPIVAEIGEDMGYGHPLSRMIDGRWISAYCSDWLGVFALLLRDSALVSGKESEAERYDAMVDQYAAGKRAEFESTNPDILIIQRKGRRWIDLLSDRFGFDEILRKYHVIAQDEEISIMLRNDYKLPSDI